MAPLGHPFGKWHPCELFSVIIIFRKKMVPPEKREPFSTLVLVGTKMVPLYKVAPNWLHITKWHQNGAPKDPVLWMAKQCTKGAVLMSLIFFEWMVHKYSDDRNSIISFTSHISGQDIRVCLFRWWKGSCDLRDLGQLDRGTLCTTGVHCTLVM